jgi:hypothetical protein
MPLYDHFHRPLSDIHEWESFHNRWSVAIADDLNRRLPKRFLASAPQHLGPFVSADVAEKELLSPDAGETRNGTPVRATDDGGIAVAIEKAIYSPPATTLSMPMSFPEEYRVEVRDTLRVSRILAVIELVSPGNKDDTESRETFAGKCLSYLAKGIGLVVIDIVTGRLANLHNWMVKLAKHDAKFEMPGNPPIYTSAYRPVHRNKEDAIDLWMWPLVVGSVLPIVPLALKEFGTVPLNLEATYRESCERSRIPE